MPNSSWFETPLKHLEAAILSATVNELEFIILPDTSVCGYLSRIEEKLDRIVGAVKTKGEI